MVTKSEKLKKLDYNNKYNLLEKRIKAELKKGYSTNVFILRNKQNELTKKRTKILTS